MFLDLVEKRRPNPPTNRLEGGVVLFFGAVEG
jgi:hypothetical protein